MRHRHFPDPRGMILHHLEKAGYPWVTLTGYPYGFGLEAYFFQDKPCSGGRHGLTIHIYIYIYTYIYIYIYIYLHIYIYMWILSSKIYNLDSRCYIDKPYTHTISQHSKIKQGYPARLEAFDTMGWSEVRPVNA